MYIIVVGGGKVGANLMRSLIAMGHEVTLIEQRRDRFERLEQEFEHRVQPGDATELFVLEQAGITRPPDILVAATGDDEDNIIICQLAREKYGVPKVVARVNDPRNQEHFDLLGIAPTVCATSSLLALVEHEVPEHGLVHLLELRKENLEIVEVQIDARSPCLGKALSRVPLPDGAQLIAVVRDGEAHLGDGELMLESGDQVLGLLQPGREEELREALARTLTLVLLLVALPAVAGAGTERQQLSIVRVARGFDQPVYVAATASEPAKLYIVEQPGRIFVLEKGKRRLFMDIRGRVGSDGSEQGLLSMAFHPSYGKNRRFYVNYTDMSGDTRVVEFRSDGRTARASARLASCCS